MFRSREEKGLKAEIKRLKDEVDKERRSLAEFKHKKKMEEEDLRHLRKIETEASELKNERLNVRRDGEKAASIAAVKDEYRDKMEKRLRIEIDNMKEMYAEILKRLPNVNMRIKQ